MIWSLLLLCWPSLLVLGSPVAPAQQAYVASYYDPNRIFFPLRAQPNPIFSPLAQPHAPHTPDTTEFPKAAGFPCGYILDLALIKQIQSADTEVLQKFAAAALDFDELPEEIVEEIQQTPPEQLQQDFRDGVYGGPEGCDDTVRIDQVNPEKVGPNLKHQGLSTLAESGLVEVGELRGPAKPIHSLPLYPEDDHGNSHGHGPLADPAVDTTDVPEVEEMNMPLLNNAQFAALQAGRKIQLTDDQIALLNQRRSQN